MYVVVSTKLAKELLTPQTYVGSCCVARGEEGRGEQRDPRRATNSCCVKASSLRVSLSVSFRPSLQLHLERILGRSRKAATDVDGTGVWSTVDIPTKSEKSVQIVPRGSCRPPPYPSPYLSHSLPHTHTLEGGLSMFSTSHVLSPLKHDCCSKNPDFLKPEFFG